MTMSYRQASARVDGAGHPVTPVPDDPHGWSLDDIPRREVIPPHPQQSVRVLTHDFPSEICGWGSHPEYEIHLITKTHGSFIAGDHIGTFGPGHLSIMGPNLPHDWVSDLAPGQVAVDRDAVVQFSDEWVRSCMRVMPELGELDEMLQLSSRGLLFTGATAWRAAETVLAVVRSHGAEQLSHLFHLLTLFARAPEDEREVLASEWLGRPTDAGSRAAVEAGLSYIFENLTGDIRLGVAARLAYMSEPTFSKYFKSATGTTFSTMVKKLRCRGTTTWRTSTVSSSPRWARHRPATGSSSRRRNHRRSCSASASAPPPVDPFGTARGPHRCPTVRV
jgi:hypothetical protein